MCKRACAHCSFLEWLKCGHCLHLYCFGFPALLEDELVSGFDIPLLLLFKNSSGDVTPPSPIKA